jgi:hypothetical protein
MDAIISFLNGPVKVWIAVFVIFGVFVPHQADAETNPLFQFQFLYEQCKTPTDFCAGYVAGVGQMMSLTGAAHLTEYYICHGKTITSAGAMIQAVVNFDQQHPEMWAEEMIIPAGLALQKTWPCY